MLPIAEPTKKTTPNAQLPGALSVKSLVCCVLVWGLGTAHVASESESSETIRLLSMNDPFARAWSENAEQLEQTLGLRLDARLLGYEETNRALAVNAARSVSAYDLVAVDIVWMGHYGSLGAFLPLDDLLAQREVKADEFIHLAWEGGSYAGIQLAVPIQPHPEILLYRKSVLNTLGEPPPRTTDDVLRLAARITDELPSMSGICWNSSSGAALGQQMLHFAGAFGASIVADGGGFSVSDAAWLAAFEYAEALRLYSPPMIGEMAWDSRIRHFQLGSCGMTYAWGARTALLESDASPIAGDVGYLAAPVADDQDPVTPMGAWLLAIPANIAPSRIEQVADALVALTSSQGAELLLEFGVSALPRSRVEGMDRYPVLPLVMELDRQDQLTIAMRPPVSAFQALSEIIGVEAHAALFGALDVAEALSRIEKRISRLSAD